MHFLSTVCSLFVNCLFTFCKLLFIFCKWFTVCQLFVHFLSTACSRFVNILFTFRPTPLRELEETMKKSRKSWKNKNKRKPTKRERIGVPWGPLGPPRGVGPLVQPWVPHAAGPRPWGPAYLICGSRLLLLEPLVMSQDRLGLGLPKTHFDLTRQGDQPKLVFRKVT